MRRRKKKGADLKLLSFDSFVFKGEDITLNKGKWSSIFNNDNPIYLEVGTGRGQFITTLAKQNPNINYIGMEIKEEVLLKAVEKASESNLTNMKFIWGDVANLLDYFSENELARLFVNFCDPWPKKRWNKRRLTHSGFLAKYDTLLNEDGEIHFKTDNEGLFEFSLNEVASYGLRLKNISLDLANSDFASVNVTTEYEDKFMSRNMKIFRLEADKGYRK